MEKDQYVVVWRTTVGHSSSEGTEPGEVFTNLTKALKSAAYLALTVGTDNTHFAVAKVNDRYPKPTRVSRWY